MPDGSTWTAALPTLAAALAFGYLLGAVPFGLLLARLAGAGDIRKIGSGNIGATNVLRTGRKGLALATLLLDGGKGAAALLLAYWYGGEYAAIAAGAGAMLGHVFPVWLGFRGGKGVATALGVLLAAAWPIGAFACATWLLMAALFRYSSLAALTALALAPVYALVFSLLALMPGAGCVRYGSLAALGAVIAVFVFIRHEANIRRLLSGTEPKIGKRSST